MNLIVIVDIWIVKGSVPALAITARHCKEVYKNLYKVRNKLLVVESQIQESHYAPMAMSQYKAIIGIFLVELRILY